MEPGYDPSPDLSFAHDLPMTRQAIEFAQAHHGGQRRPADDAPFLVHPLEVASYLKRAGYPDHVVAAAVLHDVLEDTDAQRPELASHFGRQVCELVALVSDDPEIADEEQRKDEVRQRVRTAGGDSLVIYAADKVSKVRELRMLIGQGLDPQQTAVKLRRYRKSLRMLEQAIPDTRIVEAAALRARGAREPPAPSTRAGGARARSRSLAGGYTRAVNDQLADHLAGFRGVSLAQLDERAALLSRVDTKYAVGRGRFLELLGRLRDDHDVLEIDGRRSFEYRSVYFDTPELRCFWDHVRGRLPRFKARTRLYRDTGSCVFEVKLKRNDEEMDKRQTEHPAERSEVLTDSAKRCVEEALSDAGLDAPADLAPSVHTAFTRITLAAREYAERVTCDLDVRLSSPRGRTATLHGELMLVETKTERGDGPASRALEELGVKEISLSKYRVGASLVCEAATDDAQPGSELFATN